MTPTPDQVAAALAEHVRKDMAALPGRHNTLRAGILVPLVWRGELECVLTERCAKLRHHGGEVSFPGGRPEPDDVDLAATAVRETHEEIGVAERPGAEDDRRDDLGRAAAHRLTWRSIVASQK